MVRCRRTAARFPVWGAGAVMALVMTLLLSLTSVTPTLGLALRSSISVAVRIASLLLWLLLPTLMPFMPRRKPLHIVVGAPLDLGHVANPSREQVMEAHRKYIEALEALYDRHKTKMYGADAGKLGIW